MLLIIRVNMQALPFKNNVLSWPVLWTEVNKILV